MTTFQISILTFCLGVVISELCLIHKLLIQIQRQLSGIWVATLGKP